MPFRPENVMTTLLLAAILLLVFMGVFGVAAVTIWGDYGSTPTLVYITGAVLLALKVVLGIFSQEMGRRENRQAMQVVAQKAAEAKDEAAVAAVVVASKVEQNSRELKADLTAVKDKVAELTNGQLVEVIKEVATQTRAAERDQLVADPACLEKMEEVVRKAAKEAADATAEAIVGKWRKGDPDRRQGGGAGDSGTNPRADDGQG